MASDLWEQAFACARRAAKLRDLVREGPQIGNADRKRLEKLVVELDQRAALLKARATASPVQQERVTRKRVLRSRKP